MILFETVLLFIRATRQQQWNLHLSSLHILCKYFFAFDMINYARLTPVYIAQMFSLKYTDPDLWIMLEGGNFSVNKGQGAFTAIGVDHGIEQENRAMKVLGGIKGIANNQRAPDQYFLIVSEMGNIIEEFCQVFDVPSDSPKRSEHHHLTGSRNDRINDCITQLSVVLVIHEVNFDYSDSVHNVLTNNVLPPNLARELLAAETEGNKRYERFVTERVAGVESIWAPLTKCKLPTFANSNRTVTVKV